MICEGILQYRTRQQFRAVLGEGIVVLDWDTKRTQAGRPDAVFLSSQKQLIVVEFEPILTISNIAHALITQAWRGTEEWYRNANQDDMARWYEYTHQHLHPSRPIPPDLRAQLGMTSKDAVLWDRRKRCIIIAAAPEIGPGVIEAARAAIECYVRGSQTNMPYEAFVCRLTGESSDRDIRVTGGELISVKQSPELEVAPAEGPGWPAPHQHRRGEMTPESKEVERLLPKYMSAELETDAGYYLYCKADFGKVLKLMAWHEYDADVCFEFSRMDSANEIKGPHCNLRIGKVPQLGSDIQRRLKPQLAEIAGELGCPVCDLVCKGRSWPLIQYRIWKPSRSTAMAPEEIARALGTFCSVVYPIVNPIIRSALG